ncbi:MAG: gamma-glutamyltransferase [Planctomycetes bacterium]|jgi:gamma-glutamyltranspeptidase/glutathione hydrolase|nr:gamma-glutamyltransferase [Planctomycetota bacterium]
MNGWRRLLAVGGALLLTAAAMAPAPLPNDLVARGERGAVVSAEPRATRIGLQVLAQGGNAVDAAVAVALALAVTHPQAGNLGGGGFLLLRMADGRTAALDFRERAPKAATKDMYLRADGSVDQDKVQFGATAAGVPGSPAGLLHALQKFGTWSLPKVAGPAITLAREGFEVDQFLAADLREAEKDLGRYPSTRAVFFRDDRPLQQGDMLVQRDLADTLERFAKKGFEGFYGGRTAELLVAQMERDGGFVRSADLSDYVVRERDALRGEYRGHEVISMPPPSSGGVALLQMLNLLSGYDLRALGHGGSASTHLLVECMRRAYADRSKWLGDPDHYPVPVTGLLGKEYADLLRAGIDLGKKTAVAPGVPPGSKESDDTTHFSVVDKDGNAVACTTTINSTFGAMVVVDGAGFLLNNEMDDFSAKPGVQNQFGLVGGKANAIAPGKRMLSSMTPTMVCKDGQLRLVLGAPGGGRIITAVLQVLLNVVDHGMGLPLAVRAPRVHHQWLPDEITWEPLSLSPDVRSALEQKGHTFARAPRGIGQIFAIEVLADGTRLGVCDHRSGGAAAAY